MPSDTQTVAPQDAPKEARPGVAPDAAVEIKNLSKVYRGSGKTGEKKALTDVSLTIPRGSLFGLLGPNGAGKSTLINILAGLVIKTSGTAEIWGHDIEKEMRAARRAIGIVPQELNIDPFFTPSALLDIQAGLYGVRKADRRTDDLLRIMGLSDKAEAYARTLSGGMRRRLMVAKAMVHNPPVLVLDEPTAGVDIELRQQLWAQVKALNERGVTVLLTTHYLEEAEELCDQIAIINHGRVIACDTTEALLSKMDQKELTIVPEEECTTIPPALEKFLARLENPKRIVIGYRRSETSIAEILSAVQTAGIGIADMSTSEADLEDIFLALTRGDNATAAGA